MTNVFLHFAMVRRFMYGRWGGGFNQAARLLRRDLRFYVVLTRLNLFVPAGSCGSGFPGAAPWNLWFRPAFTSSVGAFGSQLSMVLNRAVKCFFIHMSNTELIFWYVIRWVEPPPNNSDHQDQYMFSRVFRTKPSLPPLLRKGTTQVLPGRMISQPKRWQPWISIRLGQVSSGVCHLGRVGRGAPSFNSLGMVFFR